MRLVIHGNFNCPFSALASRRSVRSNRPGTAQVDWRADGHASRGLGVLARFADLIVGVAA